uniref:UPF0057-domain-containing protein n=1 Tax=Steinernema glaseri TaxID=37863 RepID=A0A1I8AJ80_9BILA
MCQCILVLVAIIFPPLAVLLDRGCDIHMCINIFLTLLGFIPGVIHAIYVICCMDGPHRYPSHHHHHDCN